ncbi:MAG: NAD(+)/NADH kinase [Bacteroidales bacterium]|nr:NAD(+)/NADH kinase [Bacteroidales bacterium]
MHVYLIPYQKKEQAVSIAIMAAKLLQARGVTVIFPAPLRDLESLPSALYLEEPEAFQLADAVITVGGDGTILHTARAGVEYGKPLLGINLGRTGFLATCELEEIPQKLEAVAAGDYKLDQRMLLDACVPGFADMTFTALNDIVIYLGARKTTMDFTLFCDGVKINHYRGDGLIFSTPTGSTAYSLSAGGPILDASISGIITTPICAHSLNSPPMVFAGQRRMALQIHSTSVDEVYICSDGFNEKRLPAGCIVEVRRSPKTVKLITFNPADQFKAIDEKLNGR